jgi:hypothetical protein
MVLASRRRRAITRAEQEQARRTVAEPEAAA